jgi:hypothetical protein
VDGKAHSAVDYNTNPSFLGAGVRPVALLESLSVQEAQYYNERASLLDSLMNTSIKNGFMFDIDNSLTSAEYDTSSMHPKAKDLISKKIDINIISASAKKAYVSASLIEFLLALHGATYGPELVVKGGFGLDRQNDTPNVSNAQSNSITDHAFGRAFDFSLIHKKGDQKPVDMNSSQSAYMLQLTTLLDKINVFPMHLVPDYIAVSAKYVDAAYDTYESDTNQLWTKYKNLKYLKLKRDTSGAHDNHIHISFSAARGGIYINSGGQLSSASSVYTTRSDR